MEKQDLTKKLNKSRGFIYVLILGALCVVLLAANLVFSKVNFGKAAECIAGMDLENGEKYLEKSKKVWLNLNDYDQTDQLCFENGKQSAGNKDYEKMAKWFLMIQNADSYALEIKEMCIEEIIGFQDWNEESKQLFESMDTVLSARSKLGFPEKDKNDTLSQFISKAVEQGNLEKAKDIILYKMELGYGPQESLSDIYQVAAKYLGNDNSDSSAFAKIREYLGVESAAEYIDNITMCEEVCSGEISLGYIEKALSWEEFGWSEEQQRNITAAKDFIEQLQGAYLGWPYFIYVNGYNIYWGDKTGVFDFKNEADSCKYVVSHNRIEIEGGLGERFISIESVDEISTNMRSYFRVGEGVLPDSFKDYQ